jgi:hypothetical protein
MARFFKYFFSFPDFTPPADSVRLTVCSGGPALVPSPAESWPCDRSFSGIDLSVWVRLRMCCGIIALAINESPSDQHDAQVYELRGITCERGSIGLSDEALFRSSGDVCDWADAVSICAVNVRLWRALLSPSS